MQARRGFIFFSFGKPATGVGLIEVGILKMSCLVIELRIITKYTKKLLPLTASGHKKKAASFQMPPHAKFF